jgi:hypothetical protein
VQKYQTLDKREKWKGNYKRSRCGNYNESAKTFRNKNMSKEGEKALHLLNVNFNDCNGRGLLTKIKDD